ncbi:M20 metallopeptidase family protein [Ilyobacter polytropus]|uniref:Amidohydrolase n=1 Tax=Ilyobacter polytropus (strain ATCC 51220 / DSM 2926 / LMG 16218 / CuHBu1) TaxID=572544 RepID=E3H6K0_ILYPC|nr:amidohydrolase [Ilyobacter polytropus]ADO81885.1 amidohydrolase [Ilyobacter polytropus DSM 2926]
MDIIREIEDLREELINLRRDFHKHPELGFQEFRTSEIITNYLKELGIEVKSGIAKTGVVGLLKGKSPGRTVLLRADMDALAIQEEVDTTYKSVHDGKMHACGHDGHIAMLLIAAKILVKYKDEINGNIKFLFQPNEEEAGARAMIDEGVLENPHVDAAFAIHLWTPIEYKNIGVTPGPVMAAHDNFKVTIKGKGGHTSSPHISIDPMIAAANVIQSVQSIQTREIDVLSPTSIIFGKINGGTASNIIPETVELEGTIRYLYEGKDNSEEKPRIRFERIVRNVCNLYRTEYELQIMPSSYAVINNDKLTNIAMDESSMIVNRNGGKIVSYICMAGEDFSEFSSEVPSTLIFVGAGNKAKEAHYPHHHPRFDIDEDALAVGVELHVRNVIAFLKR